MSDPEHQPDATSTTPEPHDPEPQVSLGEVWSKLGRAGPAAIATVTLPLIGSLLLLVFREHVAAFLTEHKMLGMAIYISGFTMLAGLALLNTWLQALVAGYVFGLQLGSAGAMAGVLGACLVGFVASRKAAGDRVVSLIHEHPQWEAVRRSMVGSGWLKATGIVTLVRFPANGFALTNLALASLGVPVSAYVLGTVLGMAPRTIAVVFLGSGLQSLEDTDKPGWYTVSGLVLLVVVFGVLYALGKAAMKRVQRLHTDGAPET